MPAALGAPSRLALAVVVGLLTTGDGGDGGCSASYLEVSLGGWMQIPELRGRERVDSAEGWCALQRFEALTSSFRTFKLLALGDIGLPSLEWTLQSRS